MPASPSSRRALGAAAIAACLALGCSERDVETVPFRLSATVDGRSLADGLLVPSGFVLNGTATRVSPTSLLVAAAIDDTGELVGDLSLGFDAAAAPELAFPEQLDGVFVRVVLVADASHLGPEGEPLPIVGFRVATGTAPAFHWQFLLYESTYQTLVGQPFVGQPAFGIPGLEPGPPDLPQFLVEGEFAYFEPAECGLVYYDVLNVADDDLDGQEDAVLGRGERAELSIREASYPEVPPVTVLHVQSWHRDGRCAGQAQAWTQLAAWRPAPRAP